MKSTRTLPVLVLMLLGMTPAGAHHSFDAEYDAKQVVTVSGVVTKIDWINPHAFVYVDVRDEDGEVQRYKLELGPPYALIRGGWTLESVNIGDTVTVQDAARARDGSNALGATRSTWLNLASGQQLVTR
jgi:hypothetical protein